MASRREEKERLRAERLADERSQSSGAKRRLMAGYIFAGLLTLVVVVGLGMVILKGSDDKGDQKEANLCDNAHIQAASGSTEDVDPDCRKGAEVADVKIGDLEAASRLAGCDLQEGLKDEGNSHVTADKTVHFDTNPPTSGDHDPTPQADGAYAKPPQARNTVHSMEHGRVEIHYSPDLSEEDQLQLKGVFDADPAGMLLFPDPKMPYDVAVTSWTNMVTCDKFSPQVLDVIQDFRDDHRGLGPEQQVPIFF